MGFSNKGYPFWGSVEKILVFRGTILGTLILGNPHMVCLEEVHEEG